MKVLVYSSKHQDKLIGTDDKEAVALHKRVEGDGKQYWVLLDSEGNGRFEI